MTCIATSLGRLFFGLHKPQPLWISSDLSDLMEQAPLSPASEMEVDDRDEYDRMLEDEDEYPDGFWEGVDELEQQYCAIVSDHFRIF